MAIHEYLTDEQVAEITHRSIRTVKKMLTAGDIRSALVAGRRLVRRDWLDEYIEQRAEGGRTARQARMRRAS
jgi:excisionase family DNA binding protein